MSQSKNNLPKAPSRREFIQTSAGAAALGGLSWATTLHADEEHSSQENPAMPQIRPNDTILFQGDSITDVRRDRATASEPNKKSPLGNGYAWLAAAALLVDRPSDQLQIFNRGISGDKVPDLEKRWQQDCLDLKPNVLSILIGVNDIWRTFDRNYEGTAETYEKGFHALIERTKAALPDVRVVICEPFVLQCGAVDEKWFPAIDGYQVAARRVSDAAGATFVPFQAMFDRAIQFAPPERWLSDGVHPTSDGAALMAHTWLRTVGT